MRKTNLFGAFAAIVVAFAFSLCCHSCSAPKEPEKKIGIQLYSVMEAMKNDPVKSVARLNDLGYNVFELVQWGGDPKVFGMEAADFKAMCDTLGIDIISTHSSIQEDPENEEEVMNRWRSLFEIQKAVGGKYFIIPSYKVEYTTEDVQRMCDYLNRVGKLAREYGLQLGYHNHAREYQKLTDSDKLMWEYLVENTNPDDVCFELDVYWCTKGEQSPVEYLRKYPDRIKLLHIKDDFVIGESGTIDFKGIFDQFYANGMSDYVVEIETPKALREKTNADGTPYTSEQVSDEVFEAARKSAEYLRNAEFVR